MKALICYATLLQSDVSNCDNLLFFWNKHCVDDVKQKLAGLGFSVIEVAGDGVLVDDVLEKLTPQGEKYDLVVVLGYGQHPVSGDPARITNRLNSPAGVLADARVVEKAAQSRHIFLASFSHSLFMRDLKAFNVPFFLGFAGELKPPALLADYWAGFAPEHRALLLSQYKWVFVEPVARVACLVNAGGATGGGGMLDELKQCLYGFHYKCRALGYSENNNHFHTHGLGLLRNAQALALYP